MSKREKLLKRLLSEPKDFRWSEMATLLAGYGYEEIQGSGSRVKFFNRELRHLIILHKPHPGSIVKEGAVKDVVEKLTEVGIKP
jgi:predicted RNA binding protein YcfA (HicA-like mRNA interferase family)